MDLNKVMLIGNLTREPEMRTTTNGTNVATFTVATNLRWTNAAGERQEKAEFHNVVVWRKLAEIAAQNLKRGSKVYVEGRLQTRTWDDQQGQKHWRTEIVVDNLIMLDRLNSQASAPAAEPVVENSAEPAPAEEGQISVEDIPF